MDTYNSTSTVPVACGCNPYHTEDNTCKGCGEVITESTCTYTSAAMGYHTECLDNMLSSDPAELDDFIMGTVDTLRYELKGGDIDMLKERMELIVKLIRERE